MLRLFPLIALGLVGGCYDAHGRYADAGGDGSSCGPMPGLFCVASCDSDAGFMPVCGPSGWACPPGTRDLSTCPPSCRGPAPYPGCVCEGTRWSCDVACPSGIDPYRPSAPGNACAAEGATCRSGEGACGGALFCTCMGGSWNCAVAEPDPVCWCGREPREGDPCDGEGATCGACCPSSDEPLWAPRVCVGGRWTAAACPAVECPPRSCPSDTRGALGQPCAEGQTCGDPCCSTAIRCVGGVWVPGPEADCDRCRSFGCGPGSCRDDQYCRSGCGPTDGIEYTCEPLFECRDCSCLAVPSGGTCEVIDGRVFVQEPLGCG